MSGEDELYASYRSLFQRYFEEDFAALGSFIHEDVVMENMAPPNAVIAGARRGRREFLAYLTSSGSQSAVYEFWRTEEWLRRDDTLAVFGRERYVIAATGKTCETPFVHHTRWRNGQVSYWREFYDTAGMQAAYTPNRPVAAGEKND